MLIGLIGIIPKLDVGPVLFTLFGYIQTLAIVHADDPVIIAACLLQTPTLLPSVVPSSLDNVGSIVVPSALNGEHSAAVSADDGDFVVAEV